jgi:hypothetical protein
MFVSKVEAVEELAHVPPLALRGKAQGLLFIP